MATSPLKQEIRADPAAPAAGAVAGGLAALRQLEVVFRPILVAVFLFWRCLWWALTALRQLIELEVVPRLEAVGALQKLIELEDHRLKAGAVFLTFGGCTVLNATALNRSANPEHLLAGFFLFIIGAAISILTLAGGKAGRAAARMERFLRGFF